MYQPVPSIGVRPLRSVFRALPQSAASILFLFAALSFLNFTSAAHAAGLRISEFMADNFRTFADDEGNYEDWIEIHNSDSTSIEVGGYYLTDEKSDPRKWRFPSVTLPPNGYLVVFASGKDRKDPLRSLHTNFKLGTSGEYLALVKADGVTVISEFAPKYPPQATGVSYGNPSQELVIPLLSASHRARVLVPTDGALEKTWTALAFADNTWIPATNGVGYDTEPARPNGTNVVIADSVRDFGGNQGGSNWFYGYWNRRDDLDSTYTPAEFKPFPRGAGALSADNFFASNVWRWFPVAAAATEINRLGARAAGENGVLGAESHWAIRRWVSSTNTALRIYGITADLSTCPAGQGDGVIARIWVDGTEVFNQPIQASSRGYSVFATVNAGSTVDFIIDPGTGEADRCDNATFTATLAAVTPGAEIVGDSIREWSFDGVQGASNWRYGFYDRLNDKTPPAPLAAEYNTNEFQAFRDDYFDGTQWVWLPGQPPFIQIGETTMRPNGFNSTGGEQWIIRRWISPITGPVSINWHLSKATLGGGGINGRIYNKAGKRVDFAVNSTNFAGTNIVLNLAVNAGEPVDFIVAPAGDDNQDTAFSDILITGWPTLSPALTSDISARAREVNSSVYLRIPFNVTNVAQIEGLLLRMKYDAGFVAYINGVELLRQNAPNEPAWDSAATRERRDSEALTYQEFNITGSKDLLTLGTNVLALHVLNSSKSDADLLAAAEMVGLAYLEQIDKPTYFTSPSPGRANGLATTQVGPLIYNVDHSPKVAIAGQPLHITATVQASFQPISEVALFYRVMFASVTNKVVMLDDGLHDDGLAGDGVYGAFIPGDAYKSGQMVRYAVQASDISTNVTRNPAIEKNRVGPRYWGTIVQDTTFSTQLPVFHWFMQNVASAESGGEASIYFNGQFLDNVRFSIHGQSSQGFPKKSYNIDLNPGYGLVPEEGVPALDDINFMTTYPDKAHMRNMLAYETYRDAGSPYHLVFPIRVQQNGTFWGDAHFMENGDENYLKRVGLDSNGALYKMYNSFESPDGEKKTRKGEGNVDLKALFDGLGQSGTNLNAFVYDNLNLPEIVTYLASMTLVANTDCCHKNYYYYRDSEGTGEWQMLPWDQDLSFGRVWSGGPTYWDDTIYTNTALRVGNGNRLASSIFGNPVFDQMYLRRLRTIMEEILQSPTTPAHLLQYERRIDELTDLMEPDAALDLAKWGTFSGDASTGSASDNRNKQTLREAANFIKYEYLPGRRNYLFNNVTEIPKSQPSDVVILISNVEYNPASGIQDQEYIRLVNTNKIFVDISGWKLSGGVDFTFHGGTVIPTNGVLYVSPNSRAFRSRTVSPKGGQRLFVTGPYQGQLSARGESVALIDKSGRTVHSLTYPGTPSPAQQYLRITEIMYHPIPVGISSPFPAEEYEYLEVRNTGPTELNLAGVRFIGGLRFDFSSSSITNLAPGARAIVARNAAAFVSRYGSGLPVAGSYDGYLEGSGERVILVDAQGESILDFSYDDKWYPITDGYGFSLVIVDDQALWNTWGLKTSWRPSGKYQGSPGVIDPQPPAFAPVVISEVMASSTPPAEDAIELHNPTDASANIGGWYLTDDASTPKKFRIPVNFTLAPHDFKQIDESQFNSGLTPFALSSGGDSIYLFSADSTGELTGYFQGFKFDASIDGTTIGLHTTSEGHSYAVILASPTLGASNTPPKVGPIVISEIMYHPVELVAGVDNNDDEYVELLNSGSSSIALRDSEHASNTWVIQGGIEWAAPTNLTLTAGERILIVGFDPTAEPVKTQTFRARFGISNSTRIYGPYRGTLSNSSDDVALYQPDAPDLEGKVHYVLVDWISYKEVEPWPVLADGYGPALHRKDNAAFGNDPQNWFAAKPSPGYGETLGTTPVITTQPASASPVAGTDPILQSAASGGLPLVYQWIFNGDAIPGATESTYVRNDISLWDFGQYQMVAMNPAGATISSNATLTTLRPAVFLKQPANRNVLEGTNATFTVTALGTGKLTYQWFYEGLIIPNATNSTLTLRNVGVANEGNYSVEITDAVGKSMSQSARLATFDRPRIIAQPQSVDVVPGETAVFSVAIQGRGPFSYNWQRNNSSRTNILSSLPYSFFTLRNVSNSVAGNISVTITNPAGIRTNSVIAKLTLLADSDRDGLPDLWEALRGLNTNSAADALLDLDGDGISNLDEYRAGTDPNDSSSYLRINKLQVGAGSAQLEFLAQSNRSYTVEFRESVGGGAWQTLTNVFAQTTSRLEVVSDPYPLADGRIYRLNAPAVGDRDFNAPVIIRSPASVAPYAGTPLTLSVLASGKGTLSYQWFKAGQPISGAADSTLIFAGVTAEDQNNYTVRITDSNGSITSQPARITVLQPPTLVKGPESVSSPLGSRVQLSVEATGNAPLTYLWLFNGNPIKGATSSVLVLNNLNLGQLGTYSVVVRHNTPNGSVAIESDPAEVSAP